MTRLHYLLMAGVVALPLGCVALPDGSLMAYKTTATGQQQTFVGAESSADPAVLAGLAAARVLEEKGNDSEAILEYESLRKKYPSQTGIAWRLAVLNDRKGDVARANLEYANALREEPYNANLLNDAGYFYYQQHQFDAAEKCLRLALVCAPKHERAWVNLGKVLAQQARYEESCQAFGHVVRPAQAAANVGILLAKEGKVTEARQVLKKALTLEPDLKAAQAVLTQLDSIRTPEVRLTLE